MIRKISVSKIDRGFISILYPGAAVSNKDTGIGSIGRIDHAEISGGGTIPMHPHKNDEILSYFRSGKAEHVDSEGFVETIGKEKLMLMKAGKLFYHEEKMFEGNEPLEGLQIFIRPGKKDNKPEVQFLDLKELHSENNWRLIASPNNETKFQFSSQTWIYDMKLHANHESNLPQLPKEGLTALIYVFRGNGTINKNIRIGKKESLLINNEDVVIKSEEDMELVLFVTDEQSEIFKEGMYSGNQYKN